MCVPNPRIEQVEREVARPEGCRPRRRARWGPLRLARGAFVAGSGVTIQS